MQNLSQIAKLFGRTISNNSPTILTAVASTGVLTTAVLAAKGGMSAERELLYILEGSKDEMPLKEKAQVTWKFYIPAASVGLATIACVVGANTISSKRNAALMSVYSLTDQAFKEYKGKVVETLGASKEEGIRDAVATDRVNNDPLSNKEVIITGRGKQLCYDSLTGRYFESDVESIRKAVNDINSQMNNEMYASQNDFYRAIGLAPLPNGDELGWTNTTMLDVSYTAMMADDGRPCISLVYRVEPVRGYYSLAG